MPANRSFDFPVSTLLRDAKRLHGALVDPATGPAVARNRYLLDEFPPRGGASAGDKPATPPAQSVP